MSSAKSSPRFRFIGASLFLAVLLFLVPALRSGDRTLYFLAVLVPCAMLLCETLLARMFSLDRMLLSVSLFICAAGIASLAVSGPEAALSQALRCGAGLIALLAGAVMIRSLSPSLLTSVCTAFLGLLFLTGGLFPSSFSLPLSEAALALLLVSFASLLARQGPVPAALCGAAALALLLAGGKTPEALTWGLMILLLLFAADGRPVIVLPALAAALALFFAFRFFPVQASRDSGLLPALVSAGAVGADALPAAIASSGTASLFPRLAGHYGLIFAGLVSMLFLPLALRGTFVAAFSRTRFHAVLAMGVSLFLSLKTLAAVLSVFGILPFGGTALPFLTSSTPDLCAHLFLTGILCGISGRGDADLAEDAHLAMLAK